MVDVLPQGVIEAACVKVNHNTVRLLGQIEFEQEHLPMRSIEAALTKAIISKLFTIKQAFVWRLLPSC